MTIDLSSKNIPSSLEKNRYYFFKYQNRVIAEKPMAYGERYFLYYDKPYNSVEFQEWFEGLLPEVKEAVLWNIDILR